VRRALAALAAPGLAVLLLLLAAAPAARATPLLDEADAVELAQQLAEATAVQGVCYGWSVSVDDQSGGPSGVDAGSNLGPDVPLAPDTPECERQVVLEGQVLYTCESCEGEDAALADVRGSFPQAPTLADVEALGFDDKRLKDDDGDTVLVNMAGALPLLVSSAGAAAPVPIEQEGAPRPGPEDVPTGRPSTPDWLRDSAGALALCVALLLGGLLWFVKLRRDARTFSTT
jgi:hypothetical protein